jgi:chemotaxis response regulator CheB
MVFGMPGAAVERNIVDEILSPDAIIVRLTKLDSHLRFLAKRSKGGV